MEKFKTKDGVSLAYDIHGEGKPLIMLHGWIATSRYFDKNVDELAKSCKVIRLDFRARGESEMCPHGHRLSRYAADVHELLEYLDLEDVTLLGWSMGASVAWMYWELFQADRVSKFVFVDMTPDCITDQTWKWGQKDCYDVYTYTRLMMAHELDYEGEMRRSAENSLVREATPEEVEFFYTEKMKSLSEAMLQVKKDHAFKDFRDLMPTISLPSLMLIGRKSKKYDWHGPEWAADQMQNCEKVFFEDSGHLLFWEEPEKFNQVVAEFVS